MIMGRVLDSQGRRKQRLQVWALGDDALHHRMVDGALYTRWLSATP
jgi:hypothetical protein